MRRSPLMREWAWHRRVWRLAWPMVVSNLSVPLLGAVDTAVIGHLPEPHFLGAVAVGALIFNTLYFGCNFLRMGTTGLTAQAFGARDFDAARATLARAFLIALVLAAALLALQGPIGWLAFYLVEPSEAVAGEGMRYFFIRIWGAPATLANIALVGWFIGMQNTRAALALLLTVNGINIVLDLVLVLGFDLAVAGVAWATVAADYAGLILGVAVTARLARRHGGHWRARLVLDAAAMRRFLGTNRDIFLRTLFVITAFALFTTLSARQGDVVLAANAVLLNFVIFFNFAFDGFAFAAEALTGRALGAGRRGDLARAIRACLLWCLLLALLTVAIYGACRRADRPRAHRYRGCARRRLRLPSLADRAAAGGGLGHLLRRRVHRHHAHRRHAKHDDAGLLRLCALRLAAARADGQSRVVARDDAALRGARHRSRCDLCADPATGRLLALGPRPVIAEPP